MASIDEFKRRIARVESTMDRHGVDALLLNRGNSIAYLTGASSHCSWLFLTRDGRQIALVLEPDYLEYRRGSILRDIRTHRSYYPEALFQRLRDELGLRAESLALEMEHLRANQYQMIAKTFGEALHHQVSADTVVEEARMVKTQEEVDRIRKASNLAKLGMRVARESAVEGITERQLAHRIWSALLEEGAEEASFLYVGSDGRSSLVHYPPADNILRNGPVVVDLHVRCGGYFADMSRTLFLGGSSPEVKQTYAYYRGLISDTIDAVTAGVSLAEVRRSFHQRLKAEEDWIPLAGPLIHGVGFNRPEEPRFHFPGGQGYAGKLEANMTLASSNIGLYSRQGWGVQYEDTFVVTDGKPLLLTREEP